MGKCMQDVLNASQNEIIGGSKRHSYFGRKPRNGVANTFGTRFPDPDGVTSVRIERGAGIPSVDCMWGPRGAFVGRFMDENANAGWRERGPIEIEVAIDLCPRR